MLKKGEGAMVSILKLLQRRLKLRTHRELLCVVKILTNDFFNPLRSFLKVYEDYI